MADYDFRGLSPRAFEHLVQALAGRVLGPGLVTFGDGPDGGREATFEGKMDFPSSTNPWDGYCVVQAKFLQRSRGTRSDVQWALKQLDSELKAFSNPKKKHRHPDYYIFATNVVLTPVQDRGGKDRGAALFEKYRRRLPLRSWAIWDYDEIRRFLDSFEDLRRLNAAWITPGDVLSEVMTSLKPKSSGFLRIVTSFLARELRSDQYANLEQAGHSADERIPLARVFIDLPTTRERSSEPPPEDARQPVIGLVSAIIEAAREPIGYRASSRAEAFGERRAIQAEGPQPGRYVLVGGPGQGKTTVGQFACQLFRAALLQDRPQNCLSAEVRDSLASIVDQCAAGDLDLPQARRFPVRIVLSDFAAALDADSDLSLLGFVGRQVQRRTDESVTVADLKIWLGAYPWFLVLDGLDEVPASTNREALLRKIEEFWIDVAQAGGDVLVLATTRPQGYGDDFSPLYYRHLWLAPLSPSRAMKYAERLVLVRYSGEPERQDKILQRLIEASKQEATARLMRSPLQVTIMAMLVEQIGKPPQDRWRLFHDYYDVIYKREQERRIQAAELLRDHKSNIDAIHHQVGLLLQVESERAGGTEARLPAERFAAVATARLEEEGYAGTELADLRARVIEAAANRLVFLVGLEEGQVGFEIRSLQEYMAAEAIMSDADLIVQERLRRIAAMVGWRNVFLFAAGRCFAQQQQQHLRDTIHTVCIELNDTLAGEVGRATRAGSVLALDILEEGVARYQPKYGRLLAHCAVLLLDLPPGQVHGRLADGCEGPAEEVLSDSVVSSMSNASSLPLSAWATLLPLIGQARPWALSAGECFWPTNPALQGKLLGLDTAPRGGEWVRTRFEGVALANSMNEAWRNRRELFLRHPNSRKGDNSLSETYHRLFMGASEKELRIAFANMPGSLSVVPVRPREGRVPDEQLGAQGIHDSWRTLIEYLRFAGTPSKAVLARALERIAETLQSDEAPTALTGMNWVFGSCLRSVSSREEMMLLAERVSAGELGDLQDWTEAEERWQRHGVGLDDCLYAVGERWPFDQAIGKVGFPFVGSYHYMANGNPELVYDVYQRLEGAPNARSWWAEFFLSSLARKPWAAAPTWITPEDMLSLVGSFEEGYLDLMVATSIAQWVAEDERWIDVLDAVGSYVEWLWFGFQPVSFDPLTEVTRKHPSRRGLLPPTMAAIRSGLVSVQHVPQARMKESDTPMVRWASLEAELLGPHVTIPRAQELARAAALMIRDDSWRLNDLAQVLWRREGSSTVIDEFLLSLMREAGDNDENVRAQIMESLNNQLRRRSSGLGEPKEWRALGLPERLLPLLCEE